jgi:hypothetical protein
MNNSHGHALKLHLQLHEGVRTFREVASVRHIMRSISVSCSRQRFKAGMVDLRVGRKAGGDRCTWSSNEPFSWTPREQLDDIDMIFRNGPMVTALDLLGLSERVSVRWCIVGRCWKMLEERSIMYRLDQCDLRAPVWPFPLKPKSKVLDGFVWKASAENCRITLTTSLL